MPADIRSFFGGGPKKPAGDAAAKPKEEKLEEPAATVLPKKAKADHQVRTDQHSTIDR